MRDTRCSNMLNVTKAAIALCAVLYGSVALSGYVLFGDETEGDVLKNLTISAISGLTGRTIATALIDFVVIANSFNLMVGAPTPS